MKFEVKTSAKIKKATIDIKDLTIFVGKNSTNKSYIAHIVYMMNKILSKFDSKLYVRNQFINKVFSEYMSLEETKDLVENLKKFNKIELKEPYDIELDENEFETEWKRLVTYKVNKKYLSNIIKSIKLFLIQKIIKEINNSFNTSITLLKDLKLLNFDFENGLIKNDKILQVESISQEYDDIRLFQQIFKKVIDEFIGKKVCSEQFYFPASRTGFVLTFDEIVSGVLRDRFGGQPTATKLTEPTIDFISGFSDIKSGKFGDDVEFFPILTMSELNRNYEKQKEKLFEFIEKRIIKGKIIEEQKQQNYTQFYLKPFESNKIELHLTSSATVELLPLVVFLKHFSKIEDRLLVIEEPEAHLHPQAQIEMARLLVMLVTSGAKVLITTHSDYILNEINNCIKLSEINEKELKKYLSKKELSEDIVIEKDRVSAYLFKGNSENTKIQELHIDKYGISNENFDDVLDELLDSSEEINELMEI